MEESQATHWEKQGRCPHCGGKNGHIFNVPMEQSKQEIAQKFINNLNNRKGLHISDLENYLQEEIKSEFDSYVKEAIDFGATQERERIIFKIKNMLLWSKGNVEGTRNDIIHKLSNQTNE